MKWLRKHLSDRDSSDYTLVRVLLPAAALVAFVFLTPTLANADTYTVDTTVDVTYGGCTDAAPNDCSLRDAIDKANARPGPDTIILPPGIYRLTKGPKDENLNAGGDLDILDDITIQSSSGNPADTIIQSGSVDTAPGAGIDKIISINPNWDKVINATIRGVTLRYGNNTSPSSGDGYGGALDMETTPYSNASLPGEGSLTIENCIITYNSALADGGGISVIRGITARSGGLLTITNSEIANNTTTGGNGGGIQTSAPYVITGTTIKNNSSVNNGGSGGYAGGLYGTNGGTITNSTISGNTVVPATSGRGAGIIAQNGLTAKNVTISDNHGGSQGGGLWLGGGTNVLSNLTVTGNTAVQGSGIWFGTTTVTLNNSIVWNNDIYGVLTGNNSNLIGVDPGIGPLADNGGRVWTHALLPGSAALEAGNNSLITGVSTDARGTGYARIVDADGNGTATVDIGAFEAESPADLSVAFPDGTFNQGQTDASYTITVTNIGSSPTSGAVTVTVSLGTGLINPRLSGTGWTCNNGTLSCTRTDQLADGVSYPITLLVDVSSSAPVSVNNTVTVGVTGDSDPTNNTAGSTTTVRQNTTTTVSSGTATYGDVVTLSASVTPGVAGQVVFSTAELGNIGSATVNTGTGTASASVLWPFAATTHTIVATFTPTNANYLPSSNSNTLTVNRAPLTVRADNKNKTYGSANPALTATYTGFKLGHDPSALVGSLTITTTATATSAVGGYPITPGGHTSAVYEISYVNGTLTVDPAPLTITAANASRTYGAANPTFSVTYSGFVLGQTESIITGTPTISTTATTASPAGPYAITPSGYAAPNYAITYQPGTLTVNPAPLTITANDATRTYGAANPAFSATYSGFVLGENETVLGGTLSFTASGATAGVGTHLITPAGRTSANYSITYADGTLTVTPATVTVTADNATRTYGAADPAFTATYAGLMNGETPTALGLIPSFNTTALAGSAPGGYPITVSGVSSANYTFTYQPGTLTVTRAPLTVKANDAARTYGAADPVYSVTYTGLVLGQTESVLGGELTFSTTATVTSTPGTYTITPAGLTSDNYTITFAEGELAITRALLTVTADAKSKVYGTTNPVFTASYSGFITGEDEGDLSGTLTFATAATGSSPVTTYPITPSGLTSANYAITFLPGTLTVTPAPLTVTANNASKVYGDANPAFTVSYNGFVLGQTEAVLGGTLTFSTTATASSEVSTYTVTPAGLTSGNYAITFAPGTLTVTPKALTVTAENKSKVYGQPNPTFTVSYSGLVAGDTASNLTGPLTFTPIDERSAVGNSYSIIPSGLSSPNYTISYVNGTLAITPAPLAVTASNKSKVYGQANPAFDVNYSGFQWDDDASDLTGPLTFTPIDVRSGAGTYDIIPSGLSSLNYSITYGKGTLTVDPAPLTVTANHKSKVYGQANPVFDVTYGSFQWDDDPLDLTGPVTFGAIDERSGAGTYDIIPGGLSSPNYAITFAKGTLTITPAPLTVTADNMSKVYGQANPTFSVSHAGFQWTDGPGSLTGPVAFAPIAERSGVGTYDIIPSGLSSPNYDMTFTKGTLTITPAALAVTANDKAKVYGQANPTFDVTHSGFQWDDDPTDLTGALAFAPIDPAGGAGDYDIIPSGLSSSNYTITFLPGTLTVDKAPLTVRADDKVRVFGDANPALTASYSGFVLGQTEAVLGGTLTLATTAVPASPVGTYPITVSGLTSPNYDITFEPGTLAVTNATLTVQAVNATRHYGDTNPAFAVTYTGFVGGDDETDLTGTLTLTTSATPASPVGNYAIIPGGLSSANYLVVFESGTLTVTPRPLQATVGSANRPYGDPNPHLSLSVTGAANGDQILASYTIQATATSPVGTYPITVSVRAASGSLSNYAVQTSGGVLTVTPAPLNIQVDDAARTYGQENPAFHATLTGLKNNDPISVTFATTATTDSSVGIYPITGQVAEPMPNYTVTVVDGRLTVTPAPLSVVAHSVEKMEGEPNPPLKGEVAGVLPGDAIHAEFATTATRDSAVGTYPITAVLRDPRNQLSNYTVTVRQGTLTIIACDVRHGYDGTRAVSRNGCRADAGAEQEVLTALGHGGQDAFLVLTTGGMVQEAIDHARETDGANPPRLVMTAQEGQVSGGMISLLSLGTLADASGELQLQTPLGAVLIPAQALVPLAGESTDGRLVILLEAKQVSAPARPDQTAASPVVEITIATLSGDGSVTEQQQFTGGLVLTLPIGTGPDGELPDLELAGIYHLTEDADGNPTGLDYIGGEAEPGTGLVAGKTDHLSKYVVLVYDREYEDVNPDHWAHRAVKVMTARHVVQGTGGDLFHPNRTVTRAEFAAMIARAVGIKPLPVNGQPFADVPADAWHAGTMRAVVDAGLFTPEAGNTLRPNVPITREEIAEVIARAMERFSPQPPLTDGAVDQILARFADQAQITPGYRDDMAALVAAGLLNGRTPDVLAPQGTASRAEAVTLIKRLLDWLKAQ